MKKYLLLIIFIAISGYASLSAQEKNYAFVKTTCKWPSNSIRVSWVNPSSTNVQQRQWVQQAVKETWEKESGLNFVWCSNEENQFGIRIKIEDVRPHTLGLGKQLNSSDAGMRLNFDFIKWIPIEGGTRAQAMNQYEYYVRVIAVHEFGHALGFEHEQKRSDCELCDDTDQSEQENRSSGDWWTPTCDLSSVMNYCNPEYSNNGHLSEGDIEGIRALYGPPGDIAPSSNSFTARLVHTINENDDNSSAVKIYLTGDNAELSKVMKVAYSLDDRFDPNNVTSDDAEDNFPLEITLTNSMDFTLNANVYYDDGTTNKVERYINFKPGVAGRVNSEEIEINFHKTDRPGNRYLFSFSIDPQSTLFERIVRVDYTRNHETFAIKRLTADNSRNNFQIEWDGWGCIPVHVKVYYSENDQLFYKTLTFDMCEALGWR